MTKHTARLRAPGDFGLAAQQARLARGLTQTELAAELGVPQSTISEIESGKATIYVRRPTEHRARHRAGVHRELGVRGCAYGAARDDPCVGEKRVAVDSH